MLFSRFKSHFVAGLLVILPGIVTLLVLRWVVDWVNDHVLGWLPISLPPGEGGVFLLALIKIGVFIGLLLIIALIGLAAKKVGFIRDLLHYAESMFQKVPMLNEIYGTTQQVSQAFLGEKNGIFQEVVLIEYPRVGIFSVGFVTARNPEEIRAKTGQDILNVFVPTVPNPTTGFLVHVPEGKVIKLRMSVGEGMKLVISGGTVVPRSPEPEKR